MSGVLVVALLGVVALMLVHTLWLRRSSTDGPLPAVPRGPRPPVDVIVPVLNEGARIDGKLENLLAQDYPADRLRIWVADGGSTDETAARVAALAGRDARIHWVSADGPGRGRQLNAALAHSDAPCLVVTDADVWLPPETLARMSDTLEADPHVALVGTRVMPADSAHPLETLHWSMVNRVHQRESMSGSMSSVKGPCYMFRRTLAPRYPPDIDFDDVHTTCLALAQGHRVAMADVEVVELRVPRSLAVLVRHRQRKAHGYVREMRRFLTHADRMVPAARTIFLSRVLTMAACAGSLLILAALALQLLWWWPLPTLAALVGVGCVVGAMTMLATRVRGARPLGVPIVVGLIAVTLGLAVLALPFSRSGDAYWRLPDGDADQPTPS